MPSHTPDSRSALACRIAAVVCVLAGLLFGLNAIATMANGVVAFVAACAMAFAPMICAVFLLAAAKVIDQQAATIAAIRSLGDTLATRAEAAAPDGLPYRAWGQGEV